MIEKNCIRKHCHPKDKDGKPIRPKIIRQFMTRFHSQFRDAEKLHCDGCGAVWTELTGFRTKGEYRAWKEQEGAALKAILDKVKEKQRSHTMAEKAMAI